MVSAWQWQLGVWGGGSTAWLLGLAMLALWLVELRSIRGQSSASRRFALAFLGALSMLAVYLLALQITLVRETYEEVVGRTAVLVDSSRSMTLSGEGASRSDEVRALMQRWKETAKVEPIVYLFGSSVRGADWGTFPETYAPEDGETRLQDALRAMARRGEDEKLAAVVLLTDAGDTSFRASGFMNEPGAPAVHAIVVGGEDPLIDEAIVELRSDPTTYVGIPASIRASIRSVGYDDAAPPRVQLWEGDRLLKEQEAMVTEEGRADVEFLVTPQHPGRVLYRLVIPVRDEDAVPQNNERTVLLRVGRDRLRVLLVAGHPTWDVRFLRDFLKRDASIDLVSFFILRTTSDLTAAPSSDLALIPFPTDELFREHLGSFDVIIFQNFDYAPYEMHPYLERIRDYVTRGGSFAMIGGDRSFASGGYADTPIGDILPVTLPAGLVERETHGRFRAKVVASLARHPIVALGPDPSTTRRMWDELPPLEGANLTTGVREGTQTLLEHPSLRTRSGEPVPILVVGEVERGRTLALMADSSWRWRFAGKDVAVGSDEYELFWDRAIRWLSWDPLLEPARIATHRERYASGAQIVVTGLLRDEAYRPLANAELQLRIEPEPSEAMEPTTAETNGAGKLKTQMRAPVEPGAYEVVASVNGERLAAEAFVVEQGSDELANLEVAPEELRRLAEGTGGRIFMSGKDAPSLDELLSTTRKSAGLIARQPLSDPPFLFFTIALLALTWFLRRRWGRL